MTQTNFKNLDDKTQGTIDKTLTTINSIWHTWFPSDTTTTGTETNNTSNHTVPSVTSGSGTMPPPPPTKSYKGLIYAGVGIGVLGVGFLIYKATKK